MKEDKEVKDKIQVQASSETPVANDNTGFEEIEATI